MILLEIHEKSSFKADFYHFVCHFMSLICIFMMFSLHHYLTTLVTPYFPNFQGDAIKMKYNKGILT